MRACGDGDLARLLRLLPYMTLLMPSDLFLQENMALVRELNQLRRELRAARDGGSQSSLIPALTPKPGTNQNQLPQPPSPGNAKALTIAKKRTPGSAQRITAAAHWKQSGPVVVADTEGSMGSPPKAEVEGLKTRLLALQLQLQER